MHVCKTCLDKLVAKAYRYDYSPEDSDLIKPIWDAVSRHTEVDQSDLVEKTFIAAFVHGYLARRKEERRG